MTSVTLAPGLTVNNKTDLVALRRGDAIVSLTMDSGLSRCPGVARPAAREARGQTQRHRERNDRAGLDWAACAV